MRKEPVKRLTQLTRRLREYELVIREVDLFMRF